MYDLDDIDIRILQLLVADGRRPYSEIAERVELSPPAVSDRVDRLREEGVIRRFTVDLDRATLRETTPVLVEVAAVPTAVDRVRTTLAEAPAVEHVFTTDDARVVCHASVPTPVRAWLLSTVDVDDIEDYCVDAIETVDRRPTVATDAFEPSCTACDAPVSGDGVTTRTDGGIQHFCDTSCETHYRERLEEFAETAEP
jgi:DNA-binding Lrp family transcriptional regulator